MHDIFKDMQNTALDGKSEIAWTIAEAYACFTPEELKYIALKEGNTSNLRPYLKARMSQISAVSLTLDFVEAVENANQIAGSANIVSMKNAEKLYNELRRYEPNLDNEQKSRVYFLASELYRRAQIIPGVYNEPKPCEKELFCLRMVLDNTANPSRIDCCLDRMSKDDKIIKTNAGRLISAYKRALDQNRVIYPEDRYRMNTQIAKLYQKQLRQTAGSFMGRDLDDTSLLRWSEYYFSQAYKTAPNAIQKYEALTELSKTQNMLGLIKQAKQTSRKAVNLLPPPENFEKMLDVAASEEGAFAISLVKRTVRQIQGGKLSRGVKDVLGQKAIMITKLKTKNPKVISSVENMVKNRRLTPNNKIVRKGSTHE